MFGGIDQNKEDRLGIAWQGKEMLRDEWRCDTEVIIVLNTKKVSFWIVRVLKWEAKVGAVLNLAHKYKRTKLELNWHTKELVINNAGMFHTNVFAWCCFGAFPFWILFVRLIFFTVLILNFFGVFYIIGLNVVDIGWYFANFFHVWRVSCVSFLCLYVRLILINVFFLMVLTFLYILLLMTYILSLFFNCIL